MDPQESSYLITASPEELQEWITILSAAQINHVVVEDTDSWRVMLPAGRLDDARREIAGVREENKGWKPRRPAAIPEDLEAQHKPWGHAVLCLCLVGFFFWTGPFDRTIPLHRAAANDAAAVQAGEWWRVYTALAMHGDGVHLLGNLVFMAMLGWFICRRLGSGLGSLLIISSGAAGNAIVALLAGQHLSVGASTATFGAVGILVGMSSLYYFRREEWRSIWSRAWIPLGVAIALFGWTGVGDASVDGGGTTDIAAHFFGLLAGIVIGAPFGWTGRVQLSDRWQIALSIATMVLFFAAWRSAIVSSLVES